MARVLITFKLPPGSHPVGAYKLVGGEYLPYPAAKTKISGEQITLEIVDNGPYDENPALGAITDPLIPVASNVPEFGRCVAASSHLSGKKTVYTGKYMSATCTTRSATATGKYEWSPGVTNGHFETSATGATFETTAKAKLTCATEHGSGLVTGAKTVGSLTLSFSGCQAAGQKCTTAGLEEGEIETSALEGALGIDSVKVTNGKESRKAGLDIYPVGDAGAFAEYACGGGPTQTLSGSVIAPVTTNKMFSTASVKYGQSKGHQKPEGFEAGAPDVLSNSLSQQVGLSYSATQSNAEPIEVNAVY